MSLQISCPSGKFHGVFNITAMVIDAYELPVNFFKSVQEKSAGIRRVGRLLNSRSTASFANDGESLKEISLNGSVNLSDDDTDLTSSSHMLSLTIVQLLFNSMNG